MDPRSFVVALHPAGDPRRLAPAQRLLESGHADFLLLFGDVTGPILTDAERVPYQEARRLLEEANSLYERLKVARAFLAQSGLSDPYREALRFYLEKIADLSDDDRIVFKTAFTQAAGRLRGLAEHFPPGKVRVLADTLACEEGFGDAVLDWRSARVAGKLLKGLGLSPRHEIRVPARYVPEEYRQELASELPLAEYLDRFDLLAANALSSPLQERLRSDAGKLVILPGSTPEVATLGGLTLVFEPPGHFSLYAAEGDGWTRTVYRPDGDEGRLTRVDRFDAAFRLLDTEIPQIASPAAPPPRQTVPPVHLPTILLVQPGKDLFAEVLELRYGGSGKLHRVATWEEALRKANLLRPDLVLYRSGDTGSKPGPLPDARVRVVSIHPQGGSVLAGSADILVEPFDVALLFALADAELAKRGAAKYL